jgi:Dockerin type I domain
MKRSSSTAISLASLLVFVIPLLNCDRAEAATLIVTRAADDGPGSLRQTILNAASGDTINFSLPAGTTVITLTSDQLLINKNLTISGPGAGLLRVQRSMAGGTPNFRIFGIGSGNVTISGLTIANGSGNGGGIFSQSSGNVAVAGCFISGNSAGTGGTGGGIFSAGAAMTITSSTISGNSNPDSEGGGISTYPGSMTTIINSTISGNTAGYGAGGIDNYGMLAITNSTISGNSTNQNGGGGIRNESVGTVVARNTIIAKNTSPSANTDFQGTLTSQGYNLIGNTSGTTITGDTTGNQLNVDPLLGPLQDNGGPTFTQALMFGRPATDKGSSGGYAVDQRGFTRPVDSPGIPNAVGGDGSDIGAFEDQNICENQIVTNNNDSGAGSLRDAIANVCTGGTITFASSVVSPINLTSDQLVIDKDLTISGPGANLLSVQRSTAGGTPTFRIFRIYKTDSNGNAVNINVTLSGLTISNGSPNGAVHVGGAINTACTLTIMGCIITNNTASSFGGGIYNSDGWTVNVTNSTISGNTASGVGGGIENGGTGTVSLTNCTVSGNSSSGAGGGIENSGGGIVNVTSSTIHGNTSTGSTGGGIANDALNSGATLSLINSTVAGNSASSSGGGIFNATGATVNAKNTIIGTNTATSAGPDFNGTLASQGYNLIGNTGGTTITGTTTGNQLNVNPMLGPLQENGGSTYTRALLSGSPAIDKGSSSGISTDQRGFTRPIDTPVIPNATSGDGSDIGAFEVQGDQLPGCGNTVVTNNNDSGSGSLRFIATNVCAGETITFASSVVSPIKLASELLLNKALTIQGPGANVLTVQRDDTLSAKFRVFHLTANGQVAISGLTISRGNGGIYNEGSSVTVIGCAISGNYSGAENGFGGGILTGGTLNVIGSTISGNGALNGGGGIAHLGLANITNSTISGNFASGGSPQRGGGILSQGPLNLINCTVASNSSISGGGVYNGATFISSRNTIIAKNTASTAGPDFYGALTSQDFNFIGNNSGATITPTQSSDQIGTAGSPIDPLLGPLQNNGGPTSTLALLAGSRAIDKGGSATDTVTSNPITIDQRGFSRPYDDPSVPNATGGNGSDIGAVEVVPTLTPSSVVSRKIHGSAGSFDISLPLTGSPGVECRSGGATSDYQVIFTFASPVNFGSVAVTEGAGTVNGTGGNGTASVAVNLTGVTNAQRITVTLFSVNNGTSMGDISVPMAVLIGDTNGNGTVNSSDVSQTKLQSGQAVTSSNFREDVNPNGTINSSDVSLVKLRSGTALP